MPCNCPKCAYTPSPNIDLDLYKLMPGTVLKVDHQFWMICRNHNELICAVNNYTFGIPVWELEELIEGAHVFEIVFEPEKDNGTI